MNPLYPPKPLNADSVSISPSASFQKEVIGVMFSIVLFFIVYLLLVIAAVALAIGCFYGGGALIIAMPKGFIILIGLGLMALGASIVFFLIKFIFAKRTENNSGRVEITETEQPALFAFIRQLTTETQTPFPKKIFLSTEVNACVFYNSSFWSMFFPVKKNLEIGLGLVNAINMGEFKAVMAHEFGHFSQRSMKLGSFTYNVNQVIYNMLYDNNSYVAFLSVWGNIDGLLAIFARITVAIAQGIQWILRQMYTVINKRYLSLSREMEFHADAVAASVSGGNNLVTALSRIEMAASCYQEAVNNVNESLSRKQASHNIFADQLVVMQSYAVTHKLQVQQGLPVISGEYLSSQQNSRVNFKNQWASHPTNEERAEKLDTLGLQSPVTEARAWALFSDPAALQERLTNHLYSIASIDMKEIEFYNDDTFKQQYEDGLASWKLPEAYQEFYKGRLPETAALEELDKNVPVLWASIDTPENKALAEQLKHTKHDLLLVEAIGDKRIDVKSFDFDGQKYASIEASAIAERLRKEVAEQTDQLVQLDKMILTYLVQQNPEGLLPFRQWTSMIEEADQAAKEIVAILQIFQEGNNLTIEMVHTHINKMKEVHEKAFKKVLRRLLEEGRFKDNTSLAGEVDVFLSKEYAYFVDSRFINEELNQLQKIMQLSMDWMLKQKFAGFKSWIISTLPSKEEQAIA